MNPETVTTGQLLSSFTARHLAVVISAAVSALGVVAYGGYWLGGVVVSSQQASQNSELRATLAQTQTQLDLARNRTEQLAGMLAQWQTAYQKSQVVIDGQQASLASMSAQLGRANNCSFIHEQILATQSEIERPAGLILLAASDDQKKEEQERIASLQRRLEIYQQQLSTCNR